MADQPNSHSPTDRKEALAAFKDSGWTLSSHQSRKDEVCWAIIPGEANVGTEEYHAPKPNTGFPCRICGLHTLGKAILGCGKKRPS